MDVHVEIVAETLFKIGPIPVTNSMLTMFIVMGLIIGVSRLITRNLREIPGRGQSLYELIVEFLLGLVEGSAGKRAARRIFPLIGGLFIFILFANYSGLLPGVGTIGTWHQDGEEKVLHPFLRAPNADLNMTLALALVTFTIVQIAGIRSHGVGGRIKHLGDPPFLFPIEVVSEVSRIVSLSARLFGNVFAGEVLLGVMYAMASAIKIAIIPLLFPVVFLFLELLFGAVQALVFALLTLIYITLATEGGHGSEGHEEHAATKVGTGAPLAAGSHGD